MSHACAVQIDLPRPLFEEKRTQISEEIHQAFIDSLEIPADDKFQVFRPRDACELVFDPATAAWTGGSPIVIQVLMVHRYTVEQKRELYRHIVTRLAAIGIRPEDIQIGVAENHYEDWDQAACTESDGGRILGLLTGGAEVRAGLESGEGPAQSLDAARPDHT